MSFSRPSIPALALGCALLSPFPVHAQGFGAAGERAQGMAGAFVGLADDASAIYWNPAGIANIFKVDAQASVTHDKQGFVGAAMPAVGVAFYRTNTAVAASESRHNGGSGEVRVSADTTNNLGVSLVQSIINTVVIGTTLRLADSSGTGAFDADAGVEFSNGPLRLGLAARNLRASLDTTRSARVGVAFAPRALATGIYGPYSVDLDVDLTRFAESAGDRRDIAVGSEQWWLRGWLATREGLRWNTLRSEDRAISGGVTVKLGSMWFAEGHVTKANLESSAAWGIGGKVAF